MGRGPNFSQNCDGICRVMISISIKKSVASQSWFSDGDKPGAKHLMWMLTEPGGLDHVRDPKVMTTVMPLLYLELPIDWVEENSRKFYKDGKRDLSLLPYHTLTGLYAYS